MRKGPPGIISITCSSLFISSVHIKRVLATPYLSSAASPTGTLYAFGHGSPQLGAVEARRGTRAIQLAAGYYGQSEGVRVRSTAGAYIWWVASCVPCFHLYHYCALVGRAEDSLPFAADQQILPEDLLRRVLEFLDKSELGAVRLTCKSFERQSTLLVTSVRKQWLAQRSLQACLCKFSNVRELQTHALITPRLAPQLKGLHSLVLTSAGRRQALSPLLTLTSLTRLRIVSDNLPQRGSAQLTSLRSLSLHRPPGGLGGAFGFDGCAAAFPMLEDLSLCWFDHELTPFSTCRHLTALHLGCIGPDAVSTLASLTDLACLSLSITMNTFHVPIINGLSCLGNLRELHWQHSAYRGPGNHVNSSLALPVPHCTLTLPHLTCLVLRGPTDAIGCLVHGLTRITGIQALRLSVFEGQMASFCNLANTLGLQAFKADISDPAQTMQAGQDPASMSRAPQPWVEFMDARLRKGFHCPECYCRCIPASEHHPH